jgi:hypothetical protein
MKMAWAGCTYLRPGGSITKNWISRVGTTLNTVAVWVCRVTVLVVESNLNGKIPGRDGKMKTAGGYGAGLKDDFAGSMVRICRHVGPGRTVPLESNYCEIDPNAVDKYGIPTLRFHYKWSDAEIKQAKHMQDTFEDHYAMGGTPMGNKPAPSRITVWKRPEKLFTK